MLLIGLKQLGALSCIDCLISKIMAENIYQNTYLENALWSNRAKANKK